MSKIFKLLIYARRNDSIATDRVDDTIASRLKRRRKQLQDDDDDENNQK